MAEDVRIKVTLETQEAQRDLRRLKGEAKGTAEQLDRATTGGPAAGGGRAPARRGVGGRTGGGGGAAGAGGLAKFAGPAALVAGAAIIANKITGPAFEAVGRPGGSAADFGAGLAKGTVDLLRNIPIVGQAAGAVFDRTVGQALNVREQAIQATAQATSGLAAAGIQVDQATLAQINAVHFEQGVRQVRNEAAARRAAPGIFNSVLALGLE